MMYQRTIQKLCIVFSCCFIAAVAHAEDASHEDHVRQLQSDAVRTGHAAWGHWGPDAERYSAWFSHSNRLIPVYSFGITLDDVAGEKSVYRDSARLTKLYGHEPAGTLNPTANYFDQTDIYRLQKLAAERGKHRIILFVFDGMDWWTTYAAAVHHSGRVGYTRGRGAGLYFQDYRGTETDFGSMVTSPYAAGAKIDVNQQTVGRLSDARGGYDWKLAGEAPWSIPTDVLYPIGRSKAQPHPYTDSAASAVSMTAGIKTYNDAINVDPAGHRVPTIAHELQSGGWAIGVVTSVPISHATPACAYSQNVHRDDYQDLTRDLVGLRSVSNPSQPLAGVDVLLGAGWNEQSRRDSAQGENFVPGNKYITDNDLHAIDAADGGKYHVVQRTPGKVGTKLLAEAAQQAIEQRQRLFGFFGAKGGHLPFRTADGHFDPTLSVRSAGKAGATPVDAEVYTPSDIEENPTLADMAISALDVLASRAESFWLMVEAGDVDWANHVDNIDNSIGAVVSGDDAFRAVTQWIERHGGWGDTALILTADHGHYLFLDRPDLLLDSQTAAKN
jgi:alkaline phosphatase